MGIQIDTLIVDDEVLARKKLSVLLERDPDFRIVANVLLPGMPFARCVNFVQR